MENLQIAICEDDLNEIKKISEIIDSFDIPVQIHVFNDGSSLLESYVPGLYDLILMDIYMTGITGVEATRIIRQHDDDTTIAFVTSSLDHALDGYSLNVSRYIEKPISPEAIHDVLRLAMQQKSGGYCVQFMSGGKELNVPIRRLIYIEQKGHYMYLHFPGHKTLQVKGRLDLLPDQMLRHSFYRCHKSFLVNLFFVTDIDAELMAFKMEEGNIAYIRRESFREAKKMWENYLFDSVRKG